MLEWHHYNMGREMIKQKDLRWGIVVCARVPREEYEALAAHAERAGLSHIGDMVKALVHDWLAAQAPVEPMTTAEFIERL
jgi:hypothetical protein